ncbi:MAG: phenylalanine--tRNA ligase subunit alpha [archaeon]
MEKDKVLESLSPIERKVIPFLLESKSLDKLTEKSEMDGTTVLRALEFLKNKGILNLTSNEKQVVCLGINGVYYQKKGLPERKLLQALIEKKSIPLGEIKNVSDLNENEAKVSLGVLKKKTLADIKDGRAVLTATESEANKETLEEKFLKKIPIDLDALAPEEKFALESLKNRKEIIEIKSEKKIEIELTSFGKEIIKENLSDDMIEQLTPKMINAGSWKGKKFRRYDTISPVPRIFGGKRHFVNQATDYAKRIWLDLGFKEMTGGMVVNSFWNFDALFTAQDHPVREMQDTFFIKGLKGTLPDKRLVENVKKAHEGGVDGSKGWEYKFDEEISKRVLLRTHTTCISAKTLKKIAESKEYPAKYFALGRCFRNETVDWKHGFEFNQTEGIVIDENANFRQLLGYLKEFFSKMGYDKIRIRPSYFPYTEPSLEIDCWNEERKEWLELGGAGMFRPEVTIPIFRKHIPVLAWGPGFDRIIMESYKIKDLRETYKNNITKLRDMKHWEK